MSERDVRVPMIRGQRVDQVKLAPAKELRRAMTPAERVLWSALRAKRLHGHHFRRQQVIAGFIVDFYCHAARLVVEVDGESHTGQEEYDAERDAALMRHGVRVLRVSNDEVVRGLPAVLVRITENRSPAAHAVTRPLDAI